MSQTVRGVHAAGAIASAVTEVSCLPLWRDQVLATMRHPTPHAHVGHSTFVGAVEGHHIAGELRTSVVQSPRLLPSWRYGL